MTNILVAYDQNRAIGARGDLPWGRSLPGDLAMFKRMTVGNSVVMGRKTFEAIPARLRPLPNRENIVLSRNPNIDIDGVICVNSLAAAISVASQEVFVIGGGHVFKETIPFADTIYATEVHAEFPDADTFFPDISEDEWRVNCRVHNNAKPDGDTYAYDFVRYDRIK